MSTDYTTLNCEEEAIQYCGQIHHFGYLFIFDKNQNCIAISENCKDWLPHELYTSVGRKNTSIYQFFLNKFNLRTELFDIHFIQENSTSIPLNLDDQLLQLTIYSNNGLVFLEFEKNESSDFLFSEINNIQAELDNSLDTWQTLCDITYKITKLDRILIYQFQEDQTGIVIAEHHNDQLDSLIGYRYPDFDIPAQARKLYLKNHFRQTPDIHSNPVKIIGLNPSEIDLSKSHIRALSPIHLQYLENFGAQASVSFSIVINNKLWGLLTCQHLTPKYTTYNQKAFLLFITQYASYKYSLKIEQEKFQQKSHVLQIKNDLKEKLLYNSSLENTLSVFADEFTSILSSDGIYIRFPNYHYKSGITPSLQSLNQIHQEINKEHASEQIYYTNKISGELKSTNNDSIKGIARLSFDIDNLNTIYWFRKEINIEEKWAGIPEKFPIFSEEKQAYIFSPRTSFHLWTKTIEGQSEKWTNYDINNLEKIHDIIENSIAQKSLKLRQLNDQLIEINNKLEAFTHQVGHDIKNPLAAIKANAQLINMRSNISSELLHHISSSIIDSANMINDIMEKTIQSTLSTQDLINSEIVEVRGFIPQLIEDALSYYNIKSHNILLGDLHHIHGDKTLLYQLFMNLINNAIKFSSKKKITRLEIYSIKENSYITYFIKDNGIGIPKDEIKSIFSVFKRLSNANQFEGSGVGMSIVKRITNKLGAEINIDSTLNKGTTFILKFPNEQ